jgi:hypothetical protein
MSSVIPEITNLFILSKNSRVFLAEYQKKGEINGCGNRSCKALSGIAGAGSI